MTAKNEIYILECTARDGSYLIDYQFTAEDTYLICAALARAGFNLIEIGHGTGLRSSEAGRGEAAATDKEYLEAAHYALEGTDAEFGMFFIPGIGRMDDLDLAADYGMNFVRIGTNVTEIEESEPYIQHAKKLGMKVSSNLMKSYAVSIKEFVKKAILAENYGADILVVVDSAGGMFPQDVHEYTTRLRDVTDKMIGYHGHNNLQLAIANTLEAVRSGAVVVDATLQGMGRSAGNAQTEILVPILEKMGYHTGVDFYKTLDIGEQLVKPMMYKQQGVDDISIVAGIAQFHSSFSGIINATAKKYRIDPRLLIMEVSEIERVNITAEVAESTARKIKKRQTDMPINSSQSIKPAAFYRRAESGSIQKARDVLAQMISLAKKTGKDSVFSLTLSEKEETVFPYIRQSASLVIGNCEARDIAEINEVTELFDGRVDWILFDHSSPSLAKLSQDFPSRKSQVAWYSEKRALLLSACTLLSQTDIKDRISVFADFDTARTAENILSLSGSHAVSYLAPGDDKSDSRINAILSESGALLSFGKEYTENLTENHIELLNPEVKIYAACPEAYVASFWNAAIAKKLPLIRIDHRIGLAAEVELVIETNRLSRNMGSSVIAGIPAVSGGMIGAIGTIVVDSITRPTMVIGVADGKGGLVRNESGYRETMANVQTFLVEQLLRKKF